MSLHANEILLFSARRRSLGFRGTENLFSVGLNRRFKIKMSLHGFEPWTPTSLKSDYIRVVL